MRLLVLFILILSSQVFACENVNLYKSRPEIFRQKIVNQGDMSTCYAHSLATIYNLEHADTYSEVVNPYWIAFNHKDTLLHWKPKNLNYSLLSWAHRDFRIAGLCSPDELNRRLLELKQGVRYSDDQLMYLLKTYFKKKAFRMGPGYNFDKIISRVFDYLVVNSKEFEKSWIHEEVAKILKNIEPASRFKDFFSFLKYDVFDACIGNIRNVYASLKSFGRGFSSNERIARKIKSVLAKNKPLAIGYCPKRTYLNDPFKTKDLTKVKPRIARAMAKNCGAHYSVIVGSRKRSGTSCEYLVRNTYGTGYWAHENVRCWCMQKSTGRQADCAKKTFNPSTHKVLGCWFKEKKLLNNTYDLSFFR